MTYEKIIDGDKLTVKVAGRLDTSTSPELEEVLMNSVEGVKELTLDLTDLEYISSSGLRLLLAAQKVMNKQGSMTVTNVNDIVMEVFEVTGFVDILTIA